MAEKFSSCSSQPVDRDAAIWTVPSGDIVPNVAREADEKGLEMRMLIEHLDIIAPGVKSPT